jgi:Carbonic anhydrase
MTQLLTKPDPARALGLEEGDAHVIRNAGGRVTDALRSIIISQQLLGTREIIVVHHVCEKPSLLKTHFYELY